MFLPSLGGAFAVVAIGVAVATVCAFASVRGNVDRAGRSGPRLGSVRPAAEPTISLGASLALDPARDRARLAASTAVAGLALAIAGAVAVALIDVSTSDVLAHPARRSPPTGIW